MRKEKNMGEERKYDGAMFMVVDGELIPFTGLARICESTEDPGMEEAMQAAMYYAGVDEVAEVRGYMTVRISRQKLYRILLGWRGRGPIRVRALIQACKMLVNAAPTDTKRSCDTCRQHLGGGLCRANLEAECGAGEFEAWEEKQQEA